MRRYKTALNFFGDNREVIEGQAAFSIRCASNTGVTTPVL